MELNPQELVFTCWSLEDLYQRAYPKLEKVILGHEIKALQNSTNE